ncbi:MAG: AAA family ATPase [Bacilli bacterium]|nr:AAA family ATPase [Bacilli bacterium]
MKKMKCQFAIKYEIFQLDDTFFELIPRGLLKGEDIENGFRCVNGKEYPIFLDKLDGRRKYYADMIYGDDELSEIFEYDGDDSDFIGKYFYENYKKTVIFIDTTDVNEAGISYRNLINLNMLKEEEDSSIYYMDNSIPNVVLNEKAVKQMLDCKTLKKIKLMLTRYQNNLGAIKKLKDTNGITRVSITGDQVNYYETTRDIDFEELEKVRTGKKDISSNSGSNGSKEISYIGLRNYIKERIFGHESEIDTFAQKLYMNHTAIEGETVESILFVGPTGTGKTETVRAACNYLNIPMIEFNAANLNTEGIVGTSIESLATALYENAGCNLEKAQRGLVFLDEFDKLSDAGDLSTKAPVKNILLTFTGGGSFPIDNNRYSFVFDSTMTNKIYAGVFDRINDKQNPMGFGTATKFVPMLGTPEQVRERIIEKKYFTQEELSRITTVLIYDELTRETKREILLNSKLSEYTKKRDRYKRQFGIELVLDEEYIDAILDKQTRTSTGMRTINNSVKRTMDIAERFILENEDKGYKKLILTKETAYDPTKYDLSK